MFNIPFITFPFASPTGGLVWFGCVYIMDTKPCGGLRYGRHARFSR